MELPGPLVAKYIRASGLSRTQVAKLLGVDRTIPGKIVSGKRRIKSEDAAAWCVALRLNREDTLRLTKAIHLAQASPELRSWIADLERRSGLSL